MTNYRSLNKREIATLTVYGCSAEKWKDVQVSENFSPSFFQNVHFSGKVFLGTYNKIFELVGGVKKHAGIYNCILHNCVIENDVFIDNIHNYIANYQIGEGSFIENVDLLMVDGFSSFGNGVKASVMIESGGREMAIFENLSAPFAYIFTFYRHRPELIRSIQYQIEKFCNSKQSDKGTIGKYVQIVNCGNIKNVCIGDSAKLEGTSLLENGTIISNQQASVYIGRGV